LRSFFACVPYYVVWCEIIITRVSVERAHVSWLSRWLCAFKSRLQSTRSV